MLDIEAKYLYTKTPFLIRNRFVGLIILTILLLFSFEPAISLISNSCTLRNSGVINSGTTSQISALHTEGRWIKDALNNTIILRGVWRVEFTDSCVCAWGGDYYNWNEANVRADMQNLRDVWKVNCIMTFIWGDWWINDLSKTLGGYTTSTDYRFALKETARIAQEYGLYFQIRLYGCNEVTEGRIEGLPFVPTTSWTVTDFVNFWKSVATEMKNYPNVIFTLFDEPTGDETTWFNGASQAITGIRSVGAQNLIVVHYGYCGDCDWMADWVTGGYPTQNIVFSNHIYRYHGTFAYNPNSPTSISYIRNFLANETSPTSYTGAAYKYITNKYNIPIWVTAIGAYNGATNNAEYTYFNNTLQVLNEFQLSYCAYQHFRDY